MWTAKTSKGIFILFLIFLRKLIQWHVFVKISTTWPLPEIPFTRNTFTRVQNDPTITSRLMKIQHQTVYKSVQIFRLKMILVVVLSIIAWRDEYYRSKEGTYYALMSLPLPIGGSKFWPKNMLLEFFFFFNV